MPEQVSQTKSSKKMSNAEIMKKSSFFSPSRKFPSQRPRCEQMFDQLKKNEGKMNLEREREKHFLETVIDFEDDEHEKNNEDENSQTDESFEVKGRSKNLLDDSVTKRRIYPRRAKKPISYSNLNQKDDSNFGNKTWLKG